MLKVSTFRPLHLTGLPPYRHSARPFSTEIPKFWSALSGVKPQIMVTNQKWGSPPASTTFSIPLQFHSFYLTLGQQAVFLKLELQEPPFSPLRLLSGKTPDVSFGPGGNWTPDLFVEKSALYHWAILTTYITLLNNNKRRKQKQSFSYLSLKQRRVRKELFNVKTSKYE